MSTLQDVLDAARQLTAAERLQLLDALWEGVPPSDWPVPSDEWIAEAQRRSAEYDQGRMSASNWPDVRTRSQVPASRPGERGL